MQNQGQAKRTQTFLLRRVTPICFRSSSNAPLQAEKQRASTLSIDTPLQLRTRICGQIWIRSLSWAIELAQRQNFSKDLSLSSMIRRPAKFCYMFFCSADPHCDTRPVTSQLGRDLDLIKRLQKIWGINRRTRASRKILQGKLNDMDDKV